MKERINPEIAKRVAEKYGTFGALAQAAGMSNAQVSLFVRGRCPLTKEMRARFRKCFSEYAMRRMFPKKPN